MFYIQYQKPDNTGDDSSGTLKGNFHGTESELLSPTDPWKLYTVATVADLTVAVFQGALRHIPETSMLR